MGVAEMNLVCLHSSHYNTKIIVFPALCCIIDWHFNVDVIIIQ